MKLWMPPFHRGDSTEADTVLSRHARVLDLFHTSRPPHVTGRVVMLVIDAIQCELPRWSSAHVGQERAEIMPPPLTHLNASPAIVPILRVLWIVAALNHRLPQSVLWTFTHPMSFEPSDASTGMCASSQQVSKKDLSFGAADTTADHMPVARSHGDNGP